MLRYVEIPTAAVLAFIFPCPCVTRLFGLPWVEAVQTTKQFIPPPPTQYTLFFAETTKPFPAGPEQKLTYKQLWKLF